MTALEDTKINFRWWPILRGAGCIIILASLIGIVVNTAFLIDVLQGERIFNTEKQINDIIGNTNVRSISLQDAKRAFDGNSAVFIDSRSEEDYTTGHIPGAINIPWEKFESNEAEYLHSIPEGMPIITYCGGGCESSAELARELDASDYSNVSILVNGWPSWVQAAYPIEQPDD